MRYHPEIARPLDKISKLALTRTLDLNRPTMGFLTLNDPQGVAFLKTGTNPYSSP